MADLVPLSDEELYGLPKSSNAAPPAPRAENKGAEDTEVSPVVVEGKRPTRTFGEALVSGAKNFVPDLGNALVETITPLLPQNWLSTVSSIAQLGGGVLQHGVQSLDCGRRHGRRPDQHNSDEFGWVELGLCPHGRHGIRDKRSRDAAGLDCDGLRPFLRIDDSVDDGWFELEQCSDGRI